MAQLAIADRQLRQVGTDWDTLAELDPLWAICSRASKQYAQWDPEAFFATGRLEVAEVLAEVEQAGVSFGRVAALDFGCGVGRLTQALAQNFRNCCGVDISPRMIRLAEQFNVASTRCKYLVNQRSDLSVLASNSFDLVYSSIVLQHIPAPLSHTYVREFVRVLRPGGVLVFQAPIERTVVDKQTARLKQLPRYHPARVGNKLRTVVLGDSSSRFYRLRTLGVPQSLLYRTFGLHPPIQMHVLSVPVVEQLLHESGAALVKLTTDSGYAGQGFTSAHFIITKDRED
jgi:2-polyprenyl-3-methyl-5-hydroxy-6-metoxy-1,4-benzoquinol methylase